MKTIFDPIGSTFQYGSVTLTVVESHDNGASCHGCWYNGYHYDDRMKKKRKICVKDILILSVNFLSVEIMQITMKKSKLLTVWEKSKFKECGTVKLHRLNLFQIMPLATGITILLMILKIPM